MKKNILIVFSLLLLTGCSINYDLEIDKDSLNETITGSVAKKEVEINEKATGLSTIYVLINEDQKPVYNKDYLYTKNLKENKDNIDYTFNYNYNMDDFVNSRVINSCFENNEIINLDNYYTIKLSGDFYCLYSDEIIINVKSNLKVISDNAKKVKNDTYTWVINKNSTDIEFTVDKNSPYSETNKRKGSGTFRIISFIVLIVLSGITYFLYKKKNNSEI